MKTRLILAVMATAIAAVCCKKEASLGIGQDTLSAGAKGGTFEISISSNYPWTASSDDKWIGVVNGSGNGSDGALTVRISPNTQTEARTGTIKVCCENLVRTIRVEQAQKNVVNFKDGDALNISWERQELSLALESNADYTVSVEQEGEWLTVISSKGLVQGTLQLSVAENAATASRDAVVTFRCGEENLKTLSITQAGRPQRLVITHSLPVLAAPVLFGFGLQASISWGDGVTENYASTLLHAYSDDGPHEIVIEASGAATASLSSISGIAKVDLSAF